MRPPRSEKWLDQLWLIVGSYYSLYIDLEQEMSVIVRSICATYTSFVNKAPKGPTVCCPDTLEIIGISLFTISWSFDFPTTHNITQQTTNYYQLLGFYKLPTVSQKTVLGISQLKERKFKKDTVSCNFRICRRYRETLHRSFVSKRITC